MRLWIVTLAIGAIVAMVPSTSGAQAVAEGALTHALSSGMGASMGKAMGRATNQMAGRVAQQTSRSVPRQAGAGAKPTVAGSQQAVAPSQNASSEATSPGQSMIVSIQGGVRPQSACADSASAKPAVPSLNTGQNASSQAAPASIQNNCAAAGDPSLFAHPSQITLPAPK
jgi:hypothetical protein